MSTSGPTLEGRGGALNTCCSECAPGWLEPEGEAAEAGSMTAPEVVAESPARAGVEVDDGEGPACVVSSDTE